MKKKLFILSLITILSINIEAGILGGGGSSGRHFELWRELV